MSARKSAAVSLIFLAMAVGLIALDRGARTGAVAAIGLTCLLTYYGLALRCANLVRILFAKDKPQTSDIGWVLLLGTIALLLHVISPVPLLQVAAPAAGLGLFFFVISRWIA